ncbi:MAG: translation initiation factor Sui1 [Desulfobacterales bacterium]|nr:translation initiation factor Sui1 [Desulfobacterales bacterium]MBS3755019.1 translation initiation factor Sui1 [Desulfobacterales bacterium]
MHRNTDDSTRLVYSTENSGKCPKCGKSHKKCGCGQKATPPAADGIVRVRRETKGRKGKGVTIITGVPLEGDRLKQLAKRLKAKCGSGGTVKNGVIEIQGDRRDMLKEELEAEGFTVKG